MLQDAPCTDSAFHIPITYVAVFDGHIGAEVRQLARVFAFAYPLLARPVQTAEFCTKHVHRNIAMAHTMGGDLCDAITKGYALL